MSGTQRTNRHPQEYPSMSMPWKSLVVLIVVGILAQERNTWGGGVDGCQEKKAPEPSAQQRDRDIADLTQAAALGKTAEVLALIKKVGDVNVRNPADNKKSPLIRAIMSRNLQTVKALVDNGADIHYPDGINRYPMYFTHISTVEIMNY